MNIVFLANFPHKLDGSLMGRFINLAMLLYQRGHNVEVVVSDFEHGIKKHREVMDNKYPFKLTYLHEPGYLSNVSFRRIYSHFCWGKEVQKYISTLNGIDLIYAAIPSLTAAKYAAKYSKKNNIKFVVDLQDLWPEAFAMMIKNKLLQKAFLPMKWYADYSYKFAHLAIAVSDTYINRILEVNKNLTSGVSVFLGNDGEAFDNGRKRFQIERVENEIIVGYIGNMSTSYDIPCIMDALAKVKYRNNVKQLIRFVLIGGGVDEAKFKDYARKVYPNTTFLGHKSYQEMAGILCSCDIVVNPIVKGSVASIINKVGDYAMSGKPVVNTQESAEYRNLVDTYECGINCECGNSDEVALAIEKLALDPVLRAKMGENGIRLGHERFDRRYTYHKIVEALEQLLNCNK